MFFYGIRTTDRLFPWMSMKSAAMTGMLGYGDNFVYPTSDIFMKIPYVAILNVRFWCQVAKTTDIWEKYQVFWTYYDIHIWNFQVWPMPVPAHSFQHFWHSKIEASALMHTTMMRLSHPRCPPSKAFPPPTTHHCAISYMHRFTMTHSWVSLHLKNITCWQAAHTGW